MKVEFCIYIPAYFSHSAPEIKKPPKGQKSGRSQEDSNNARCSSQRSSEINADTGASRDNQIAGRGGKRQRLNRISGALQVERAGMYSRT